MSITVLEDPNLPIMEDSPIFRQLMVERSWAQAKEIARQRRRDRLTKFVMRIFRKHIPTAREILDAKIADYSRVLGLAA
jgi:hypothetical protein